MPRGHCGTEGGTRVTICTPVPSPQLHLWGMKNSKDPLTHVQLVLSPTEMVYPESWEYHMNSVGVSYEHKNSVNV